MMFVMCSDLGATGCREVRVQPLFKRRRLILDLSLPSQNGNVALATSFFHRPELRRADRWPQQREGRAHGQEATLLPTEGPHSGQSEKPG